MKCSFFEIGTRVGRKLTLFFKILKTPGDGVSPPSLRALQSSNRSAPPATALIADSIESTHTSNNIFEVGLERKIQS